MSSHVALSVLHIGMHSLPWSLFLFAFVFSAVAVSYNEASASFFTFDAAAVSGVPAAVASSSLKARQSRSNGNHAYPPLRSPQRRNVLDIEHSYNKNQYKK